MLASKDTFEKQWQVYCTNDLSARHTESHQKCEDRAAAAAATIWPEIKSKFELQHSPLPIWEARLDNNTGTVQSCGTLTTQNYLFVREGKNEKNEKKKRTPAKWKIAAPI